MLTSWQSLIRGSAYQTPQSGLSAPTTNAGNTVLMQWGDIQFQVWPLNYHEMDHETSTDWARKEIAGAATYREWVGENDEIRYFRGRLFPYRVGGYREILKFDAYRRAGVSNKLISGGNPGMDLGWFVCDKLTRSHTYISAEGIGQQIEFEATFARVPVPGPDDYLSLMWSAALTVR